MISVTYYNIILWIPAFIFFLYRLSHYFLISEQNIHFTALWSFLHRTFSSQPIIQPERETTSLDKQPCKVKVWIRVLCFRYYYTHGYNMSWRRIRFHRGGTARNTTWLLAKRFQLGRRRQGPMREAKLKIPSGNSLRVLVATFYWEKKYWNAAILETSSSAQLGHICNICTYRLSKWMKEAINVQDKEGSWDEYIASKLVLQYHRPRRQSRPTIRFDPR